MAFRRLILVRHAKAEQSAPDAGRPLTSRGRRDAQAVGEWLRNEHLVPDRAVVSPSLRTLQTWEVCAAAIGTAVTATVDGRIYANSVEDVLAVISDQVEDPRTLALVGHNPSIHALAWQLAGTGAGEELATYPTATVAVFAVDDCWQDLRATTLTAVVTCRG